MKCLVVAACLVVGWTSVAAQSLGDVARKEEERRKTIAKPSRVYTNQSLKTEPPPSSATTSGATTPATGATATPSATTDSAAAPSSTPSKAEGTKPDGAKPEELKNEAYWRKRMTDVREALSRDQ